MGYVDEMYQSIQHVYVAANNIVIHNKHSLFSTALLYCIQSLIVYNWTPVTS